MTRNGSFLHWLLAGIVLALATLSAATPAAAQRYYGGGGFFGSLFGGGGGNYYYQPQRPRDYSGDSSGDYSRAPAAKKSDAAPTTSVMVMGDAMADWLAYGLEEAFADAPEIGILRRHKTYSGLLRYETRSDLDWWHVARDLLGKDKTDFVVMMLGVGDRQAIRETAADRKKEADKKEADKKKEAEKKEQPSQPAQSAPAQQAARTDSQEDDEAIVSPEPSRGGASSEFRSERWEQIYTKRIDETIAALKSKGVPVIWVGLPPIRGTRSTADAQYLNQLYRARAEANGIVYVDVWDGFADEGGKFTYQGPDFEGQTRRLRSGDGVHFTKQGARKLAHYVEREIRRFMSNRSMPMAMPSPGGPQLQNAPSEPAARPVAGPVVPLTGSSSGGDELLGGRGTSPIHADATASRVLVKGESVAPAPGRADDFKWPRGSEASAAVESMPSPVIAPATSRAEPKKAAREAARDIKPAAQPSAQEQRPGARRAEPGAASTQQQRPRTATRPQQQNQYQQQRQPGLFGIFR
jgi:uncharacterized protein